MKKLKALAVLLLAMFTLAGCGFNKNKNALIVVNDMPITKQQFDEAFDVVAKNPMFEQMGVDLKADPNSFLYLMLKDRVVNELIVKTLLDNEIDKRKIKVSEDDVNKEMANVIDKIGSKDKFKEIIKQNGVTEKQFRNDLTDGLKVKKLVDSLSIVSVSDSEVAKYYKTNMDKFKYTDKVRASHILVMANPEEIKQRIVSKNKGKELSETDLNAQVTKEIEKQLAKANKILNEVKKDPTEFAKIAKANSDDTISAAQGGDLGYFSAQEMVPEFSKAAFSMKPNVVSDLVHTPYGYHIIMVTDRVKAGIEPLDKVKPEIKEYLENQEKVKILQKFVDTLKSTATITYNDPSYNPEEIQKLIKEQAKKNPALMESQKSAKE